MAMWRAIVSRPIYWKGQTIREGETLELTDQQMRDLDQAGVIGAMKRVAVAAVETATIEAPETTARNYRRGGR